uniref:Uncharacterized protein n=1 Tax=Cyprinus carpio TaxID=7962 RepID=A0A8C2GDW4_CYPCA
MLSEKCCSIEDPRRERGPMTRAPGAPGKMASLCRRQQCTIERRGFRQELDSWRHKLIHCVGFESILEGLFGPGLIKDLTLSQGQCYTAYDGGEDYIDGYV